ncbi:MAG: hypothetical protein GQ477_01540 [Nanohaloarchaea archaeon]|nr:hypothetical protein [Candidatus Nanohaloarchaea archaeon]
MDLIVKQVTKIVFPFMVLYGFYIALHGHLTPGGGFAAGAIIGSAFALLVIAFDEQDVEHKLTVHELIDLKSVAGFFMILIIGKMGYSFRAVLIESQTLFNLWSGGFTIIMNVAGTFMVSSAIVLIIYSIEKEAWKK